MYLVLLELVASIAPNCPDYVRSNQNDHKGEREGLQTEENDCDMKSLLEPFPKPIDCHAGHKMSKINA